MYSVVEQMMLARVGMVSLEMSALHKKTCDCGCESAEEKEKKPIR